MPREARSHRIRAWGEDGEPSRSGESTPCPAGTQRAVYNFVSSVDYYGTRLVSKNSKSAFLFPIPIHSIQSLQAAISAVERLPESATQD